LAASDENGKEDGEEEGVIEIRVRDHSHKHNEKGEAKVGGKNAAAGGFRAEPVTDGPGMGEGAWCLALTERWETVMGRGHGVVSAVW